jgi:hypothetical protein
MDSTSTFFALEAMMQNGSLVLPMPELANSLQFLEEKGLITAVEKDALLVLAKKLRENDQLDDASP